jgi:hypothetical protein
VRDIDWKVIVLTQQDGAWSRDLFAASALFTLIEEADGKWWIYRASLDDVAPEFCTGR